MLNVFFVDNPWRLINAYEAMHYFKTNNNILVILDTKNSKNCEQMNRIIETSDWDDIIYIAINSRSNMINYAISLIKLKKHKYDNIFLGWGWYSQLIFANLTFNNAYLIDDGLSAITIYNQIKNNKINFGTFIKKKLRFIFFGLKVFSSKKINFFTAYKLPNFNGHKVFDNPMKFLMHDSDINSFYTSDEIYIIGQPMVEKRYIIEEKYFINAIKQICSHFKNDKIIYILHRDESFLRMNQLGLNNMTLMNLNEPIEQYFLKNNISPRIVVGFFSSALANLDFIFKEKVDCYFYKINEEELSNDHKELVIETVKYFRYTNVKRLTIN